MTTTGYEPARGAAQSESMRLQAFFSYGFRPFFLGASVHAALAMALWLAWIGLQAANVTPGWVSIEGAAHVWHAHEMVLGFGMAAVAGFLLTAVPNWTGATPIHGPPLVALFVVWLAGRFVMLLSGLLPAGLVAIVDLAFVPFLAGFATRQLLVRPQRRNMIFLALLAAMLAGNVVYHLAMNGLLALDPASGLRLGLLVLVVMIVIIGGRIVPSFTHNYLHLHGIPGGMPRRDARVDLAALVCVVAFAALMVIGAPAWLAGSAALVAALANGVRLAGWRGIATGREPIVWVLHLGYGWVVAGLVLAALAALAGAIPMVAAMHAFGTGAVGTMTLAVMSRASLGHTGRPLVAPQAVVRAYLLVQASAVLRILASIPAVPLSEVAMLLAGLAWVAAFTLFAVEYFPILTTPRVHQRLHPPA